MGFLTNQYYNNKNAIITVHYMRKNKQDLGFIYYTTKEKGKHKECKVQKIK